MLTEEQEQILNPPKISLSLGEGMIIMQALHAKIDVDKTHLEHCPNEYFSYFEEEIRITQKLYDKLKKSGYSES